MILLLVPDSCLPWPRVCARPQLGIVQHDANALHDKEFLRQGCGWVQWHRVAHEALRACRQNKRSLADRRVANHYLHTHAARLAGNPWQAQQSQTIFVHSRR